MISPFVVFVGCLLLWGAGVALAVWAAPRLDRSTRVTAGRRARAGLVADLGAPWSAATIALAGFGGCFLGGWFLGEIAQALQQPVDVPVFEWAQDNAVEWWVQVNDVVTQMGNIDQTQMVVAVSIPLVSLLWWRRGLPVWVPTVFIGGAYVFARVLQIAVIAVVDREPPPTTNGLFFSGGVARIVVVWGTVAVLVAMASRQRRRTAWALALAVSFAAVIEAYTRTYLLKHWVTDAVGGLVMGPLMLAVIIAILPLAQPRGPSASSDL